MKCYICKKQIDEKQIPVLVAGKKYCELCFLSWIKADTPKDMQKQKKTKRYKQLRQKVF